MLHTGEVDRSSQSGNDRDEPMLAGFDSWIRRISPDAFAGDAFIPASLVTWLKDTFTSRGALPREQVDALLLRDQRTAAEAALNAVLDDVERIFGFRPPMEVAFDHHTLRVA
jgi:hypothetical protein